MNMLDALKSEVEVDGKSMRHCENKNERLTDAEPKIVSGGIHNLDDTDVKKSSSKEDFEILMDQYRMKFEDVSNFILNYTANK